MVVSKQYLKLKITKATKFTNQLQALSSSHNNILKYTVPSYFVCSMIHENVHGTYHLHSQL